MARVYEHPSANGQPAVNARDRIGAGPWYNAKGARVAQNVGDLHGDTLDQARVGNALNKANDSPKRATRSRASATCRTSTTC